MKPLLSLLALILVTQTGLACINRSGTTFNGKAGGSSRDHAVAELKHALITDLVLEGAGMEVELRDAKEFEKRSDYSVALMFLGRSKEAVTLLEQLEKERPGQYFIAANLGTAYELSGNNEEALRWIKEGIRRNPESHMGTEWLHVKILEAKIAQQGDPQYFSKHSVLNLDPKSILGDESFVLGTEKISWKEVKEAIRYQLGERLQFVKTPDESVASLLFDYAAIEAAKISLESARGVLQMALDFGYPATKVEPLMKLYDSRIFWRETRESAGKMAIISLIVALVVFAIWRALRGRLRKTATS